MDLVPENPNADRNSPRERKPDDDRHISGDEGFESSLSPDDFRRLGVRAAEARLTVIRQAAVRSTKSLARRQLSAPSPKTELLLSQVATSAYRLMDPRKRDDASERIHVGRILPNALRWASKTRFSFGQSTSETVDPSQSGTDVVDDEPYLGIDQIVTAPQTGSDLDVPWSNSLDSSDLLKSKSWIVRTWRRQLRRPLGSVALILLLLGASYGFWNSQQASIHSTARANVLSPSLQSDPELEIEGTGPAIQQQASGKTTSQPATAIQPATAMVADQLPVVKEHNAETSSDPDAMADSADSVDTRTGAETEFAAEMGVDESDSLAPPEYPVSLPPGDRELAAFVEVDEAMFPLPPADPDQELASLLDELKLHVDLQLLPDSVEAPAMPPADPQNVAKKKSVPRRELVEAARLQLIKSLPALDRSLTAEDAAGLLVELLGLLKTTKAGSVEAWTIGNVMAETQWLVGDRRLVARHLQPLQQQFAADLNTLLATTYVGMPKFVESEKLHSHVLQNGLTLADRMLLSESMPLFRSVTTFAAKSASFLDVDEDIKYLDQLDEAATSMDRLRETASKTVLQTADQATASGAGITGRYYCLMLRKWKVGLPWLAKGSDRRLAKLSQDELAHPDATIDEQLDIADRWLATASRHQGREADSMRLHAVDLLRSIDTSKRGLKELASERVIDAATKLIPAYLQSVDVESPSAVTPPSPIANPAPSVANSAENSSNDPSLLNGRVRSDNQDLGIGIEYELATNFGELLFENIKDRLKQNVTTWTIELVGEFAVSADAKIRFRIGATDDGVTQEIWLNDDLVTFAADTFVTIVPADAGTHRLRWSVTADQVSSLFLIVDDATTGKEFKIRPAYQPTPNDLPTLMTVEITRAKP